jgi:GT2 family glycosyltransferase
MVPINDLKPIISVLITCHNRREKTLKCLSKLFLQNGLNADFYLKVFLVDDASTDGTSNAVTQHFPEVRIIEGNGKLFWNRGMHLAWQVAKKESNPDYYLWLNDDTYLKPDCLQQMMLISSETKKKAAIVGSTYSKELNRISYGGNSKEGRLLIPNGHLQAAYSFNGNVVLIPKYICKKVGILDPIFQHSIGDFEYALRIRKNNLESFITKDYVGYCDGSDNLPSWCSSNISLFKRIKNLYSPLGNSNPYYYFIFKRRYFGIVIALKHMITIHLRVLFPKFWLK